MHVRAIKYVASLVAMTGLCALAGCAGAASGPAAATTSAPIAAAATVAPTDVGVPTPGVASAQAGASSPGTAPSQVAAPAGTQATTSSPVPAPAAAASPPSSAGGVRLVLDASASQASFHAHEQLVGKTLPSEAVGTSPAVSGAVVIDSDGSIAADQSTITVDLTQLKSDESRRDNYIKSNTLQTKTYPTATFVARSVQGLPTPLPTSGEATFQLLGDLTVHEVTRPVTWQVSAQFADTGVTGTATTNVNISDFGMTPPKVGPVLSIEDRLGLELAFTAARAG